VRTAEDDVLSDRNRGVVGDGKRDRNREERSIRELHLGDDALVIGAAEESVERRETAGGKELEVAAGALGELH
jgi:hypothetical protein